MSRDTEHHMPAGDKGSVWESTRRPVRSLTLGLFFASGAAALVYQVLWVRELRLLFGSTAQSASIAIAIFFAGIASGGAFWGRRVGRSDNPLRTFGFLELGVAAVAFGYFGVVGLYYRVYPAMFAWFGDVPGGDTLLKVLVAATLLFPAAFLMGGTLPAMGEHLIRRHKADEVAHAGGRRLATTGTTVYAVNTLGSATGALAAGFVLPMVFGYQWAYLVAIGIDATVGLTAVVLALGAYQHLPAASPGSPGRQTHAKADRRPVAPNPASRVLPASLIWTIAVISGFTTLAVEIIWTRLFAQVLQNSAYTYSIVLTTFLLALAAGAFLSGRLARTSFSPTRTLILLLVAAGIATATSLAVFHWVTGGLGYVGGDLPWGPYLVRVAAVAVVVMGLPAVALGAVLPYLLRMLGHLDRSPGGVLGRLVAVNTVGAIGGSLAGGFILLPLVGPWHAMVLLAAIYPMLAIAVVAVSTEKLPMRRTAAVAAALAVLVLAVTVPVSGLVDAGVLRTGEVLVESRHGPQANVAVVQRNADLAIRVNTTYTLGGTRALHNERDQALIPLLVHPEPQSVFFLGMGTGLTAGAALSAPVERVVVCELIDDVVAASRAHFGDFTNGLFDDQRVTVISEDGRNCLARSNDRYDLIVSDLFVPWEAGTGYLYTREHYEMAVTRLKPGGKYVQWVPLYQVSDRELGIIAATMDEVFDQVVAWRGDFSPSRSAIALVGQLHHAPLDPTVIPSGARSIADSDDLTDEDLVAMLLRLYVGNISASRIFSDRAVNTDSRPVIEQLTPRTQRKVAAGQATFVVGEERERLYEELMVSVPPEVDPYLALVNNSGNNAVRSGRVYSQFRLASRLGDNEQGNLFVLFNRLSPVNATGNLSPARTLLPRELPGQTPTP